MSLEEKDKKCDNDTIKRREGGCSMKKMHLIRQHDEKDCGAACLSMILEYYGLKLPMAVIRDAIQVDQNGANIYGMLEGASRFGLKGDARVGSAEDVWEVLSGYDFSNPVIIRILNRGVYEHYVVVSDFKGNMLSENGKKFLMDFKSKNSTKGVYYKLPIDSIEFINKMNCKEILFSTIRRKIFVQKTERKEN